MARTVEDYDKIVFMTCILEVDKSSSKWAKTVDSIIKSIEGVNSCRINEMGMVEVSGTVNPSLLLKKLSKAGKNARVHWLQSGKCSSNLFVQPPPPPPPYGGGGGYPLRSYGRGWFGSRPLAGGGAAGTFPFTRYDARPPFRPPPPQYGGYRPSGGFFPFV